MVLVGFITSLLVFVLVGALAMLKRKKTQYDYLLSSQETPPWLVALSAVATNNSGYMFVGQIGFTYLYGLASIWLMLGFILGDFLVSFVVHRRLREAANTNKNVSFAGVLSHWFGQSYKKLQFVGGLITLAFLGTYAAAQLSAGSKALYVLLGWPYEAGAIIGAAIVLLYCFSGGIRASIWTDAAQSFVMIVAMFVMFIAAMGELGGLDRFIASVQDVSPTYANWFLPENHQIGAVGPFLFVFGWFLAGIGVIGQPQIMVRFMVMDRPESMTRVRFYYYSWYVFFYSITILVGMAARLLLPELADFDPELALPTLAKELLHPLAVGLVLAGLFAATMSTADSQILACTAALTHDVRQKPISYSAVKGVTLFVTLFALSIALFASQNVFVLVLVGWSSLASAFGPLLVCYALGGRPSEKVSMLAMLFGVSGVLVWRYFELTYYLHDIAVGLCMGGSILIIDKLLKKQK